MLYSSGSGWVVREDQFYFMSFLQWRNIDCFCSYQCFRKHFFLAVCILQYQICVLLTFSMILLLVFTFISMINVAVDLMKGSSSMFN